MSPQNKHEQVLVLNRCRMDDFGHWFGLRAGDVLLAVDGRPWRGTAAALQMQMARAGRPSALSFQRGAAVFTVLCERADLGRWAQEPPRSKLGPIPDCTETLRNWEIMVDTRGNHDLFAANPSWLALVAPPLWLAQARLWAALALFFAVAAVALPAGGVLVACVWLAAGLHLWRDGAVHQRVTLNDRGYRLAGVVAAPSEAAAMATWQALVPQARFRFSPTLPMAVAQSEPG